jgi:RNA 2',3'-cyclic 3'-phosphodiesterase
MYVFAGLVPPRDVLEHVTQVVAGVHPEWEPRSDPGHPGRHASSSARLFGRRRTQDPLPALPSGPLLDPLPVIAMHVPIVKFGHLALTDTVRLTNALEAEAPSWGSPRLHLHGGLALEPEGDDSVWVRLGGDVEELNDVVRGLTRVAQGLQLFVDRRVFRPEVRVGRINDRTTEAYLEQLLATLDAFEGNHWWQTSLSLLNPIDLGRDKPPFKVHREIRLGTPVPH